jgi:hypothetical protein
LPEGNYTATDVIRGETVQAKFEDGRLVLSQALQPNEIWLVKIDSS